MGKCNKSDYNHVLYNQNRARAKSGDKLKNVIDHVILLKKKELAGWTTTRLKMAWLKADAKLKKYGITQAMINAVIESKWLSHLTK
jgi:hypothetical protein